MYLMHNQNILGKKVITELAGKQQIFVQLYRACPIKPSTGKNSLNEVHLHLMLIIQKLYHHDNNDFKKAQQVFLPSLFFINIINNLGIIVIRKIPRWVRVIINVISMEIIYDVGHWPFHGRFWIVDSVVII